MLGERSKAFIGITLGLIGIVGATSVLVETLDLLEAMRRNGTSRLVSNWLVADDILHATHFILIALGAWYIVRGSKWSTFVFTGSIITWALAIVFATKFAIGLWHEQGREQANPTLVVLMNVTISRCWSAIWAVVGLVYAEKQQRTAPASGDDSESPPVSQQSGT